MFRCAPGVLPRASVSPRATFLPDLSAARISTFRRAVALEPVAVYCLGGRFMSKASKSMTNRSGLWVAALAVFAALPGCAGDLEDPDAFSGVHPIEAIRPLGTDPDPPGPTDGLPPECSARGPVDIFKDTMSCGGPACHGVPGMAAAAAWVDLVTDPDNLATRLSMTDGTTVCVGHKILDVANPTQSLLLTKLNDPPACGARMPVGGPNFTDADRACLAAWVTEQATLLAP
jgi:hypothetical protein